MRLSQSRAARKLARCTLAWPAHHAPPAHASCPVQVQGQVVTADALLVSPPHRAQVGRLVKPNIRLACRAGQASLTLRNLGLLAAGTAAAVLPALLPPAASLGRLMLHTCHLSADSWAGCDNVLEANTRLATDNITNQGASLLACLAALLDRTPRLRQLELVGLGTDDSEDIGLDPELDMLAAGLPPALAAMRHLESLTITGFALRSLPHGPYLDG